MSRRFLHKRATVRLVARVSRVRLSAILATARLATSLAVLGPRRSTDSPIQVSSLATAMGLVRVLAALEQFSLVGASSRSFYAVLLVTTPRARFGLVAKG